MPCRNCADWGVLPSMLPGLPPRPQMSELSNACPSRVIKPALPSRPMIGFASDTCRPIPNFSIVSVLRPAASTWHGSTGLLLKYPALNISKLAIANPSLRRYVFPDSFDLYDHFVPAPASKRTETRKRSMSRRVLSWLSIDEGQAASNCSTRGRPPASKCCHRP